VTEQELVLLIETFARHELGFVPPEYAAAIECLAQTFHLGLVMDKIDEPPPISPNDFPLGDRMQDDKR
jgi:hypothetical protein